MPPGRTLAIAVLLVTAGGAGFAIAPRASQAAPEMLTLDGDLSPVHDPVMIKEKDTYYVFCTGGRNGNGVLPIRTSKDLKTWTRTGFVFPESLPEWTKTEVPRANNAWAPDIAFSNGKFLLYYSVSSFGSRDSAIGLVTNTTLDPSSPNYKWVDEGMVVRSFQDKDDWNAIDANLFVEDDKNVWLNWGSFWGGIKMRRRRSSDGQALDVGHDAPLALEPPARPADRRLGRSARSSSSAAATSICSSRSIAAAAAR